MTPECDVTGVGVVILGLLTETPMHPYQVFQILEKRHDTRLVKVNAGAVYHGMERLDKQGLVEKVAVERQGRRPERTTYTITPAGRSVLTSHVRMFLSQVISSYPLFPVGVAQAHLLEASAVVLALTERRAHQSQLLHELQQAATRLRAEGLPRRYLLEVDLEIATLNAEIAWIDQTNADLSTGELDWTTPYPCTNDGFEESP